ncbi:MAG: hotdog fold thioesterase [Myxococcaceae bacterium]|jgi:uncharacterized protein (TIGR00369 family)|nr:hotdog fold thioesterase [Myxococcaceae bacterium]MCA3013966.1 hotdog fold thioesterase [Myxococcaceae bacterium]
MANVDLAALNAGFQELIPHNKALGLTMTRVSRAPPWAELMLPWDERLVGHPETRALHGGVVSTLLDTTGGAAVYVALAEPLPIATLDLRVDFLGPTTPERPLYARAECVRLTRHVAFVRMTASHEPDGAPLALASATYMLSTRGQSVTRG